MNSELNIFSFAGTLISKYEHSPIADLNLDNIS